MGQIGSIERYRFGPFELQLDQRRLLKDGKAISLRPRAFDLLAALVGREQEIAQLRELVTANRLVTLTGAGGSYSPAPPFASTSTAHLKRRSATALAELRSRRVVASTSRASSAPPGRAHD